ncbi:hypothetical protein Lser_V15G33263 [Lactuca serriola]
MFPGFPVLYPLYLVPYLEPIPIYRSGFQFYKIPVTGSGFFESWSIRYGFGATFIPSIWIQPGNVVPLINNISDSIPDTNPIGRTSTFSCEEIHFLYHDRNTKWL